MSSMRLMQLLEIRDYAPSMREGARMLHSADPTRDIFVAHTFKLLYHFDVCDYLTVIDVLKGYYQRIEQDASKSTNTVCRKGCNSCCTSDFEISITEFFMILNMLDIKYGREFVEETAQKVNRTLITDPCIFINSTTGGCDIYEVRPLICRKYGLYYTYETCPKLQESDLLLSSIDTLDNTILFDSPFKADQKIQVAPRPITYWFTNIHEGELHSKKMRALFSAAFKEPVEEFIKIIFA